MDEEEVEVRRIVVPDPWQPHPVLAVDPWPSDLALLQ